MSTFNLIQSERSLIKTHGKKTIVTATLIPVLLTAMLGALTPSPASTSTVSLDVGYADLVQWISKKSEASGYNLSPYEQKGAYHCSIREQEIVGIQIDDGFVLIIFRRGGPISFLKKEISVELLRKLNNVNVGHFYSVLCLHSFFRDDWQEVYDKQGKVNHRLLNIWGIR